MNATGKIGNFLGNAFMYYLLGLVVSAFPFGFFTLFGIILNDASGIVIWPLVAIAYAVILRFAPYGPHGYGR